MHTKIISHRGRTHNRSPDNSVISVEDAIEAGADMVEFDVRLTKDRKLVCFHDTTIKNILISDIYFSDLIEINPMVPTLEQVLWVAEGKIDIDIELKEVGYEAEVLSAVLPYFGYDHFMVKSFHRETIKKFKEIDKRVTVGLLLGENWSLLQILNILKESLTASCYFLDGADFIAPYYKIYEAGLMWKFVKNNIPIQVWTVNDRTMIKTLVMNNVHSVVTDEPEMALAIKEAFTND